MIDIKLTRFKHLIAIVIFAIALYIAIDKRHWWLDLRQLSVNCFVLLSAVTVLLWLVGGFIQRLLYSFLGVPLKFGEATFLAIATSLGNYVPFIQGGAIFRSLYLKDKYGLRYSQFVASLGSMYLVSLITFSGIGLLALVWLYFTKDVYSLEVTLGLAAVFVASGLFYFLMVIPLGHQLLGRLRLNDLLETSLMLHRKKQFFFGLISAYIIVIVLQATQLYLAYISLGYRVSFLYCLIAVPFTVFVSLVGITPGGLGLTEAVIAFTSGALGYGLKEGAVASTLVRAVSLFWLLPLGGLSMYLLSRKKNQINNYRR